MKSIKWKTIVILTAFLFVTASTTSLLIAARSRTFELNQFWLQKNEIRNGNISSELVIDYARSLLSLGFKLLLNFPETPEATMPDPANPDDIFAFLLKNFPGYAIVYPTETYYYYRFTLAGQRISGNIRLLDAHLGIVHIGYFFADDPQGRSYSKTFDPTNGLHVENRSTQSGTLYRVSYRDQTVQFKLPSVPQSPAPHLNGDERFVSWIQDESGIKFNLIFNEKTSAFYYLLDEHSGTSEVLEKLESNSDFLLGKRSSFVFYEDRALQRKLLVGVSIKEVYLNSYFDGPFDQVPPRLKLRDFLYRSYPYTQLRGGLDEHGNFNNIAQTRVAISPYLQYDTLSTLIQQLSRCDRKAEQSILWSCLTYEWKRNFHLTLQGEPEQHYIFTSQGWPANHHAHSSTSWPPQHLQESSKLWPRDHEGEKSSVLF